MRKFIFLIYCLFSGAALFAQVQRDPGLLITVGNEYGRAFPGANVALLGRDSVVLRTGITDTSGRVRLTAPGPGKFIVRASHTGYKEVFSNWTFPAKDTLSAVTLRLLPVSTLLQDVTVVSKKQAIQFLPDKTVINPEASISNAGATVMDLLEKSPGITVSKDGSIIMKGKPAVMVLIDGKPTQLSGADLQAYLSGMSASQVEVVELIENPGAKYDASGNAGIINIKTKAGKLKGFNGSMNLSMAQGRYTKTGNSLNLNLRNGKMNWFLNYGNRAGNDMLDMYTLRRYFNSQQQDSALLEQPNFTKNFPTGNNVKAGFDFFLNKKVTLGLVFNGGIFKRRSTSYSAINWMDPGYHIDSTINTWGLSHRTFKRGGLNLNGKFNINDKSELSADLDYVRFSIGGDQNYQTQLEAPGSAVSATKGETPSDLSIVTVKTDYARHFKGFLLEAGLKAAFNKTDNLASYYYSDQNNVWQPDYSRSNHFLYDENISAVYASVDAEKGKWHWQAGLRYEYTAYKAHQLGNILVKDSAFKRNYGNVFPTGFVSFEADSNHTFTFRTGERIDRPPFQFLNPFLITLNKYTYEGGNPYIKPQYTWNFSFEHAYKQMLITEISYSYLRDYFSQIFIIDSNSSNVSKNIIIYTRGNVGSFQNAGITETFQKAMTPWWNLTAVAMFNHKVIKGFVWGPYTAKVDQLNVSLNNQFQFTNGWGFELSGYYQTKSQIDLQEWLKPQGELNAGVSKQIMKKKGTLKLSIRDLTYFQNYSGYSTFQNAHEPFKIKWDSRVVRLNFSWRFGKAMKPVNRSEGGAADEINRAGSGN